MSSAVLATFGLLAASFAFELHRAHGTVGDIRVDVLAWLGTGLALSALLMLVRERRADAALRDSEQRYRLLAENVSDAIGVLDLDLRYAYASPAFHTLAGHRPEELVGRSALDLVHPDDVERVRAAVEAAAAGTAGEPVEYRLLTRDGGAVWVEGSMRRLSGPQAAGRASVVAALRNVNRRKQIERELHDSHERLNFALEAAQAGVWNWDPATDRRTWSDSNYQLHGLDPACPVPTHEAWLRIVHPEDRAAVDAATRGIAESGRRGQNFEFRILRPDGTTRWLSSRGRMVSGVDGQALRISGLNFDVSSLKEMEEALRRSEARLRRSEAHLARAQAVARTGSWELDVRTGEAHWSSEMYRILDLPESWQPTREGMLDLVARDARDRLRAFLAQAEGGITPAGIEIRIPGPEGGTRYGWCECEPARSESGEVTGIVGTLQDVTELRLAETRRLELERQLQQAQKMEALGTLAGGIAHDLNNALMPVLGMTELILEELPEDSRSRADLALVLEGAARARALVRQILAFSRKEAPERRAVDLAEVVASACDFLRRVLPAAVDLRCRLAAGAVVLADPMQLHQVVINLVTNAAQAIGEAPGAITVELEKDGATVRLAVADTGPGMDDAVLARVFEPFFTTKPVGEGTGLGLAVVHGIVAGHHGRIGVESRPGAGAVFTITLPATTAVPAAESLPCPAY
jgi:PAS domain S-box-containing protein